MKSTNALKVKARLKKHKRRMEEYCKTHIGYQTNTNFDYSDLDEFYKFTMNNVGDPFTDSPYLMNTREFERELLLFFAELFNLPKDFFWGYVTTGGTEGNLHSLFLARERFPDGILYFSEDTHYSVPKAARILKIPHVIIKSQNNGEMNYDDLNAQVKKYPDKPALICLNIGTTMKGAIDDISKVHKILQELKVKRYHIHADAALFGMMLPFLKNAPELHFKLPIDSLSFSGHKFIGSPIPCGVVLTYKRHVKAIEKAIEYVGVTDTTIGGSRNALAPLILWYAINQKGETGLQKEVQACIKNAQYLLKRMRELGYPSFLNPYSNIVYFPKVSDKLCKKWQLAVNKGWSHIIVMQHVTKRKLDSFIDDLLTNPTEIRSLQPEYVSAVESIGELK